MWRGRGRRAWKATRWLVIGGLFVTALALGWIGFDLNAQALGQPGSFLDNLYRSLQLFIIHSGAVAQPVSWQLEVARFLAPAVAAGATLSALAALLGEQLSGLRVRFYSNHVVVCGLGRLGSRLARTLRDAGYDVVGVESDAQNGAIARCREDGVVVLVGDGTDPAMLRRARAHRARYLFAVAGDDGRNSDIAIGAGMLADGRSGSPLTCFVNVIDDKLSDVLRQAGEAVNTDFHARSPRSPQVDRLPIVVWSRFYFDLEPYLAERSAEGATLLAFYHNQLRDAATAECLEGEHAQRRNAALAGYFRGRSDPKNDRTWTGEYARGLSELPFHLAAAGDKDELFATLTDFTFLEHKAAEVAVAEHLGPDGTTTRTYAGVYGLQDDYELAIAAPGGGAAGRRKPLIVTGTDFGQGLVVRCPWCNVASPLKQEWRGADIDCSNCKGPLRVNDFVVGK